MFFYVYFFVVFSFLLIGEKVNTQWLSHAIFDPVVSWSYFLSFVLFHDFFLFSLFVLLVSVCVLLWLWWREWWWLGDFEGVVEVGLGWFGNCGSCLSKFHVLRLRVCECTLCECFVALLSSSSCEGSSIVYVMLCYFSTFSDSCLFACLLLMFSFLLLSFACFCYED